MGKRERHVTSSVRGFGWEPGTLRKAGLVAIFLILVVAGGAWWWPQAAVQGPLAKYLRQGGSQGAALLQRDLLTSFPLASSFPPLLSNLGNLGFNCFQRITNVWECRQRLYVQEGRILSVQISARTRDDQLLSLDVSMQPTKE